METMGERIRHARNARGLSQLAIAKNFGISRSSVAQWESDETSPTGDKLFDLARVLNVEPIWLMQGEGERDIAGAAVAALRMIKEFDVRFHAGAGGVADDAAAVRQWYLPDSYVRHELNAPADRLVMVRVEGDSMEPLLGDGDIALIDRSRARPSPPGIFALDDGIGLIIKQIEHIPNTSPAVLAISSRNASYRSYERPLSEVMIFGRVAGSIRRL